ncbi:NAD(P)/FAD-dependent oxidoreductase [Kribbella sp. NPDC050124]|uniref:NAD(P)/FAD-dependent oxidoreductase n=1 Tax=Kribbella sp. NPDC050124 TaxID=3364114 RepID=UPI00378DB4C8
MSAKPSIAVIGSGVAGLSAAYGLRAHASITLFERDDRVGGHASTVEVEDAGGTLGLDTAFIVFNAPAYPNLTKLFDELGVDSLKLRSGFNFFDLDDGMQYGSEQLGLSEDEVTARYPDGFQNTWREVRRFHEEARRDFLRKRTDLPMGEYLDRGGYSEAFRHGYFILLCTAVWSVPAELIWELPATTVIAFFMAHDEGGLGGREVDWRTVAGGSISYVRKVIAAVDPKVRLNEPVTEIHQDEDGVVVTTAAGTERFDYAVVATHADQARDLLQNPTPAQQQLLEPLRYNASNVELHTDASVLPVDRSQWRPWNYGKVTLDGQLRTYVTYYLNQLHGFTSEQDYFVSPDSPFPIANEKVIKTFHYEHPIIDLAMRNAQQTIYRVNEGTRLKLCGSYFHSKQQYYDQIGSHEAAFSSGMEAAAQLRRELGAT